MHEGPPEKLAALLERLKLTPRRQLQAMRRHARRLARDLPLFESVWIDALAQARLLTPFQAAEINAGRGERLRVGPYVLQRRLASSAYLDCYAAQSIDARQRVRLAVSHGPHEPIAALHGRLQKLAERSKQLESRSLSPVRRVGVDDHSKRLWAASRHVSGRTAAEWMVHHGRFPPSLALEIARRTLEALVVLERAGLCHGDVCPSTLILTDRGEVVLTEPGLRGILRPVEGSIRADLGPEAYDCLAPERISAGLAPSTAGDTYAWGCLVWHLLAGRPPLPGGDTLAKLRAIQTLPIADVRRFAPDTPEPLAAAISACTRPEPSMRPQSLTQIVAMLGSSARAADSNLARGVRQGTGHAAGWRVSASRTRRSKSGPSRLAMAGPWVVAALALAWSATRLGAPEHERAGVEFCHLSAPGGSDADVATPSESPARPTNPPGGSLAPQLDAVEELVLDAEGPVRIDPTRFRPGQHIRGPSGQRALVAIPPTGWVVDREDLTFRDIDFVWGEDFPNSRGAETAEPCMIRVAAARAEFRGCSFQAGGNTSAFPAAICWSPDPDSSELALPSGRLRLKDSVFRRVGAAVDCRRDGATAIELTNVLHLGVGALVECRGPLEADDVLSLELANVTLRDAGPLLEYHFERIPESPGEVRLVAEGCAFASREGLALLSFAGPVAPDRLLDHLVWSGQGSLVSPRTPIAVWRQRDGRFDELDDARIPIAGLVRGEIAFAAPDATGPEASRLVRWQAPLRSGKAPGIAAPLLPKFRP